MLHQPPTASRLRAMGHGVRKDGLADTAAH